MKKIIPLFTLIIVLLIGCSNNSTEPFKFKSVMYEQLIQDDIFDGIYVFVREDCLACHELFELLHTIPKEERMVLEEKKNIYKIETSTFSLEQKAEIIHRYGVEFVPMIIIVNDNSIVYEKIGGFTQENIKEVFNSLLEGD